MSEMTFNEWVEAGCPMGVPVLATAKQMQSAGVPVARPVLLGEIRDDRDEPEVFIGLSGQAKDLTP